MTREEANKEIWLASYSEEHFCSCDTYSSKEDAISNGRKGLCLDDEDGFYVGRQVDYVPAIQDGHGFIEDLIERDYDKLGDWADSWIDKVHANKKLHERIEKKLQEIVEIILEEEKPTFFLVEDVESVMAVYND